MTDTPVTIPTLPAVPAAATPAEIEAEITVRIAEICAEYHLPEQLAHGAAEVLVRKGSSIPTNPSDLPRFAPELYAKRPILSAEGRRENVVEFLRRIWKPWMDACLLTRADLRKFDHRADKAVENWLQQQRELPDDINLPAKRLCRHAVDHTRPVRLDAA